VAVRLGAGRDVAGAPGRGSRTRHHLAVLDASGDDRWNWSAAAAHDRQAFLRGVVLGSGSLSFARTGPHVEFVFRSRSRAKTLQRRLADTGIRGAVYERRSRAVVYVKGREQVAALLQLTGAHGALLELEAEQVGHDVQNRLNRLLNAEAANVGRTVRAAERQVRAIERLEVAGRLDELSPRLRVVAEARRAHPEADLEALADELQLGRSAVHHRLRRIEQLAG
jgi:DNA-binding protein WhiA